MNNIITDIDELNKTVDYFSEQPAFIFDVETMGEHRGAPHVNDVRWISIATEGMTKVIPMGHPNGDVLLQRATRKLNKETKKFTMFDPVYDSPPEQLRPSQVFGALKPLFFSDQIKGAHNQSFDMASVAKYLGGLPSDTYTCTITMQWLLDENMKQYKLKGLVNRYYENDYDQEEVGKKIELHPFWKVAHYSFMDAKYDWLLYKKYLAQIKQQGLEQIYAIEQAIMPLIADIRLTGTVIDVNTLESLHEDLEEKIVEIEGRIYSSAGRKFNLNSNPQKQQVLFGKKEDGGQALKPWKFTSGGKSKNKAPSTDSDVLESYPDNPVASAMAEYSEVNKLQTSFVEGYLGTEDKESLIFDGKMYPEFVQYGTTTGRFSCRRPNLQQVPRPDSDLGKKIRNLFLPPPGHSLIVADWGQVELLIIAHYSKDPALCKAFANDQDPHSMTAKVLFNLPCDVNDVKTLFPAERQLAKTINFAIAYGAGYKKLAVTAGVSNEEAKEFSQIHEKQFANIYKFKRDVVRSCRSRKPPYVQTMLGRKRRLPGINSAKETVRWANERQAVNTVIQGSQADLVKIAMATYYRKAPKEMPLTLVVHDEMVVVCPDSKIDEGVALVENAMTGPEVQQYLSLPLKLDLKVVKFWGDAK